MVTKRAVFKVDNGTDFDEIMFKTTAEQVQFTDGLNFQQKLDNGTLRGPIGPTGPIGPSGPKGNDGLTTKVVVNGTTYTHVNGTITLPNYPTNTWRGIQNVLTSDSTVDSLSAAQGKALKTLIDTKSNSSHTHSYAGSSTSGGAANSANILATARKINGTTFNGSADITTAKWGTSRTLTLGGDVTGSVSIDGSTNVTLSTKLANAPTFTYVKKEEQFVIASSKTTFTLTKGSYAPGTGVLDVYFDGFKQPQSSITETSSTSFTIPSGMPNGTIILAKWVEKTNAVPDGSVHNTTHLPGGNDAIPLASSTTHGLMDKAMIDRLIPVKETANNARFLRNDNTWQTITPANIGALATSGTAAAATKLATARTINGVSFNGTANITITAAANGGNSETVKPIDTRSVDLTPFQYKGVSMHLKQNTTDGFSYGGTYHGILHLTQWNDTSGGAAHQIALADNETLGHRISNSSGTWNSWKKITQSSTVGHIHTSTAEPTSSDGNDGDIWIVYEGE